MSSTSRHWLVNPVQTQRPQVLDQQSGSREAPVRLQGLDVRVYLQRHDDKQGDHRERRHHRRLHGEIVMIPPFQFEGICHHYQTMPANADAGLTCL